MPRTAPDPISAAIAGSELPAPLTSLTVRQLNAEANRLGKTVALVAVEGRPALLDRIAAVKAELDVRKAIPTRARKSKVTKPRAPRTAPVRTLRVRIKEISAYHLAAFDVRVKSDPTFATEVRSALDHKNDFSAATQTEIDATTALDRAKQVVAELTRKGTVMAAILNELDDAARAYATVAGDAPATPDHDGDVDAADPGPVPSN